MQRAGEPLRQIKWCLVVVPVSYRKPPKYIDEHRERYKGNGSAMSRGFCDQSKHTKQEKYFTESGASKKK